MAVAPPSEAYLRMIRYAEHKAKIRTDQLFLQSLLAGYWIAIYGHALCDFCGQFYAANTLVSKAVAKGMFALLFPGAFVALVYTGAELFTGNTVAMMLYACHYGKRAIYQVTRVWGLSLFGNFMGALFGAVFFTYLSGAFSQGTAAQEYLHALALLKVSRSFGQNFILAIACNSLVCLATWCTVCSDDGAGKILAIFYCISIFVAGGYEHIIANMYILSAASFTGYPQHSFIEIVLRNWCPVFLGNVLAGTVFTGVLWWYALHPAYVQLTATREMELVRELSKSTFDIQKIKRIRGKRNISVKPNTEDINELTASSCHTLSNKDFSETKNIENQTYNGKASDIV